ncbi:MAG: SagB/ThcOx family dehydrogenase [Firmicutes bacterium]|jgi:SagB-type dehydrogenase family enzyme|nr:SagB/ThcOx family dehydrogenase [Bacillota bacterium]
MSTKVGIEFMLNTQLNRQEATAQQRGLPPPSPEMPVPAGAERIALPPVEQLPDFPCDLTAAIGQRRSVREYAETPLSIEELTYLLWCTQGVHHSRRAATLRSVPSAGARHPFETFLLINRVDGLQPGLYRYLALSHELVVLQLDSSLTERVVAACANQRFIAKSGVTFFWVAVPARTTWRYGSRGYRYIHLDAGHICQNLYLAAQAIQCGCCAVAAFHDDRLNEVLGLDGENAFVAYVAPLGKRADVNS